MYNAKCRGSRGGCCLPNTVGFYDVQSLLVLTLLIRLASVGYEVQEFFEDSEL